MELYQDILTTILKKEEVNILFPNLQISPKEIVELECYRALQKIKAIIEDDSFEDKECFMKMEEVLSLFEELGSHANTRHDFG